MTTRNNQEDVLQKASKKRRIPLAKKEITIKEAIILAQDRPYWRKLYRSLFVPQWTPQSTGGK